MRSHSCSAETGLAPCGNALALEGTHFECCVVVCFDRIRRRGLSVCQPLHFSEDSVSSWRRSGVLLDGCATDSRRTGCLSRFFPDHSSRYRFVICRILQGLKHRHMGDEHCCHCPRRSYGLRVLFCFTPIHERPASCSDYRPVSGVDLRQGPQCHPSLVCRATRSPSCADQHATSNTNKHRVIGGFAGSRDFFQPGARSSGGVGVRRFPIREERT